MTSLREKHCHARNDFCYYCRMSESESKTISTIDTEKALKLIVESRNGFYDYYMDQVDWSDVSKEEYYFLIPSEWLINDQDITKDTEVRLLGFIKQRQFRFLGPGTRYRYEVIDFKKSFTLVEDLKKQGQKIIFQVELNGEILQTEMSY